MSRSLHIPLRGLCGQNFGFMHTCKVSYMLVSGELVHITSVVCNVHYLTTILGSTAMAEPI